MAYAIQQNEDQALSTHLAENYKNIILNDKEKAGLALIKYFIPYLNNISEGAFVKDIYP
jgi:hypothetical protein